MDEHNALTRRALINRAAVAGAAGIVGGATAASAQSAEWGASAQYRCRRQAISLIHGSLMCSSMDPTRSTR